MPVALYDRVVVKEIKENEELKTDAGIIINETVIAKSHTKAVVKLVGDDVKSVKPEDVVLFSAGSGNPILIEGVEMLLLRAEQIDIIL
jgi:co-chaperonin GroES (HSP10)